MRYWLIGTAFVLLASGPLVAQGHGQGKGNGGGHGNASHGPAMQGPSMKGPPMKGPSMKGSNGPPMANAEHGHSAMRPIAPEHGNGRAKGNGHGDGHGADHPGMVHGEKNLASQARMRERGNGKSVAQTPSVEVKVLRDGRHYYSRRETRPRFDFAATHRGLIDGCPPGLAKKNDGCLPPGQAKRFPYQPAWWGLGGLAAGPYIYDNGYLLRLNGDSVASYVPLLGGALSVGNIWPSTYAPLPMPPYYVDYYDLGPSGGYRYADDALYRVDPATSAITSIAGLLTGDDIRIGSPMPPGYDVYNVPYPYRGQYADGPDARYRYSDGYLYQIDPTTQLVTAAIDLLAG